MRGCSDRGVGVCGAVDGLAYTGAMVSADMAHWELGRSSLVEVAEEGEARPRPSGTIDSAMPEQTYNAPADPGMMGRV